MSARRRDNAGRDQRAQALLFFALGDPTRLALLAKLSRGSSCSIVRLTEGSALTRQAVTKHLRVLQHAGLVRAVRRGREQLYRLEPGPIDDAKRALEQISRQWDAALLRLKAFVEE